jgi:hypothetical protein
MAIALAGNGCSGTGAGTSRTASYKSSIATFSYPVDWRRVQLGPRPPEAVVEATFGPGQYYSYVDLQVYRSTFSSNVPFADRIPHIRSFIRRIASASGGHLQGGADEISAAGVPAVRLYVVNPRATTDFIIFYHNRYEYHLLCQYAAGYRERILAGCRTVIATLHLGRH